MLRRRKLIIKTSTCLNKLACRTVLVARQRYGENRSQDYVLKPKATPKPVEKVAHSKNTSQVISHFFDDSIAYFLPKGYPSSVAHGYKVFALGQFLSSMLSASNGVLSMQALLHAVGVGAGSLPLAATLNWVIKDGLGQLGGVIFTSLVSNQFDADPKKWRFLASLSMELATLIELLTPLLPGYFLLFASVANIGKNISFLAASASRAAIHKSFAIHENLADVTAKTGSQWVLASMMGTGLGISIVSVLGNEFYSIFSAYLVCSSVSLGVTYYSLNNVTITTLSLSRLESLIHHYFSNSSVEDSGQSDVNLTFEVSQMSDKNVLSPLQLRDLEYLLGTPTLDMLPPLYIGYDLNKSIKSEEQLQEIQYIHEEDKYLINVLSSDFQKQLNNDLQKNQAEVHLLFREGAGITDLLLGLVNAHLARSLLVEKGLYKAEKKTFFRYFIRNKADIKDFHQNVSIIQQARDVAYQEIPIENFNDLKPMIPPVPGGVSFAPIAPTTIPLAVDFVQKVQYGGFWVLSAGLLEPRFARISTIR